MMFGGGIRRRMVFFLLDHPTKERFLLDGGLGRLEKGVFEYLWKSIAPSNVVACFWTIFLD